MIIIIPTKPRPQGRHRSYFFGKRCHYVDPSARDKKLMKISVESYLKEHYPDFEQFLNPRISCLFHFPYPIRMPVKLARLAKRGLVKHRTKPDVDNCLKLVLDALTGVLYKDDCSVSLGPCIKCYSDTPKTIIHVEETSDLLYPWELQPLVYNPDSEYPQLPCKCHTGGCVDGKRMMVTTFGKTPPCENCGDMNPNALQEFMSLWDSLRFDNPS